MSHWYDSTLTRSTGKAGIELRPAALEVDALTTRPTRQPLQQIHEPRPAALEVDALTTRPTGQPLQQIHEPRPAALEADALTTRPTGQPLQQIHDLGCSPGGESGNSSGPQKFLASIQQGEFTAIKAANFGTEWTLARGE